MDNATDEERKSQSPARESLDSDAKTADHEEGTKMNTTTTTTEEPPSSSIKTEGQSTKTTSDMAPPTTTTSKDTARPTNTTAASTSRGPNKSVNYKVKFQRARDRLTKVQNTSHTLLKALHEAQAKERKLEEEVDYLLDALAARRPELAKAAMET
ncbi:unnamed protein product [Sympodiomycopsis kandeliae]